MPESEVCMKQKMYDDQLIIVTGAAGFIGSGVVRYLNDKGYSNLILVDDFHESPKWKNLYQKKFMDIISKHELFSFLSGREKEIEAFIHLGACSDTVMQDGDYFMENNYRYSVKLAEYALKHNHRFIYASSAATYGMGEYGFSDDHNGLDHLQSLNLYGFSKHLFDLWLKRHGALDDVVGLKYFNVFGPNESHKGRMASMVYHMTHQIQKEGSVRLFKSTEPDKYKDGGQKRDFIYVKDAVDMTCSFLSNDITGIYNVGRGETETWNELASAVFKALGKAEKIEYISMPVDLAKQYQNYTCADMNKYYSALASNGIEKPIKKTLEESVIEYVSYYLIEGKTW